LIQTPAEMFQRELFLFPLCIGGALCSTVNTMMKTPGAELGVPARIGAVGTLLRIVSGETAALIRGEAFRVQIPELIQGRVIVMLKGQEITLEGLPKSLEGKLVTFRVANSGSLPALEIINPPKTTVATTPTIGSNTASGMKQPPTATLLGSEMKPGLLAGTKAQPDAAAVKNRGSGPATVQTPGTKEIPIRKATLTSPIHTITQLKGELRVVVTKTSGKNALLTPIPATVSTIVTKPTATTVKTAHAVAHTKHPETLINRAKAEPIEIRVNNLSAPLKKGEQLLVEINKGRGTKNTQLILKPVDLAAKQSAIATKTTTKVASAIPNNTLLTARVDQRLSNGNIAFQWQGQLFEAPAPPSVRPGDMLLLKNVQGTKAPTLEVIDLVKNLPEKAITLFKQRIAMSEPLSQMLKNLTQPSSTPVTAGDKPLPAPVTSQLATLTTLLENYTVTSDKPLDGNRLASMIRSSGQLYEALLGRETEVGAKPSSLTSQQDIKAVLLKLIEVAQAAERSAGTVRITQAGEQGAARIESQQAINLLAFQQVEPVRIEFPLIMQGMLSAVQMAISMETRGADYEVTQESEESSSDTFNILFALELSQLGNVRVDARITTHSVHATIFSEMNEARHILQEHLTRLTERLETLGFKDIHISTASNSELIEEKKESFSRLELGLPLSKGLLDVTG